MSAITVTSVLHYFQYQRKSKLKHRTTSLALFALVTLSFYIFFVAKPSLDLAPIALHSASNGHVESRVQHAEHRDFSPPSSRLFRLPPKPVASIDHPELKLNGHQELAAVAAFLTALPQNTIPRSVNPAEPIDPQVVLDFNVRSPRAMTELNQIVLNVWSRYPVMLFTKLHHSKSLEITRMISKMNLNPAPAVFELDQREDADVLVPLLHRLTSSSELPVLLIAGKPVGSIATIRELQESGELEKMIADAGAVVNGATMKKKAH